MASPLQTSDYVAISCAAIQLLASVAVAVWTVRKTVPAAPKEATKSPEAARSILSQWGQSVWLFALFGVLAVAETLRLILGDEPLTKTYVIRLVLTVMYAAANITAVLVAFFYIVQDRLNESALKHMQGTDRVLQGFLEIHKENVNLTRSADSALASTSKSVVGSDEPKT
jgi:hypothetical protein